MTRLLIVTIPVSIRPQDEALYRRFVAGKLIYKPYKENNAEMVEIPFASLANPLNGTFDLSDCGELGKFLKVSTGYKTSSITENRRDFRGDSVTEVWITPRFLVEQNLAGSAKYFDWLFHHFTEPIGLYWTNPSDRCEYYNISGSCYGLPHFGMGSVYNLQTPIDKLSSCNLIGRVWDMTMSPYKKDMVRHFSAGADGLQERYKDAMLYVKF